MKYRREIDGLRAIAVTPVVLFHAGLSVIGGGFLGVDIFFVISGFLITSILIEEIESGKLSILNFYERRARRILPAAYLVIAAVFVFSLFYVFPRDYLRLARSIISVVFFYSNFLFMGRLDYFAPSAEVQPLLHTWSLAVEEQFYVFFPLLLLLFFKQFNKISIGPILLLAGASLISCQLMVNVSPSANFYLTTSRAWELLAGALCAVLMAKRTIKPNEGLALAGLAGVIGALFLFDKTTPHPSAWTVIPVAGTCLIILYGQQTTLVGRLLSAKPLVGIGLISYSVYLWHQPLIVFEHYRNTFAPEPLNLLVWGLMSFPLGYLSWRFVEQPFRKRQMPFFKSRRAIFLSSAVAGLILVALSSVMIASKGLPQRFDPKILSILEASNHKSPYSSNCLFYESDFTSAKTTTFPRPDCTFPNPEEGVDVAIVGDSHADAVAGTLIPALIGKDIGVTQVTIASCAPWPGYSECLRSNKVVNEYLLKSDIPVVVLASRYSGVVWGFRFDNTVGGKEAPYDNIGYFEDPDCADRSLRCRNENAWASIRKEVRAFVAAGKKVILVGPIPEGGWNVPNTYAKLNMLQRTENLSYPYDVYQARYGGTEKVLEALVSDDVRLVSPKQIFCNKWVPGKCTQAFRGSVYYVDGHHLSMEGSSLLVPEISSGVEHFLKSQ